MGGQGGLPLPQQGPQQTIIHGRKLVECFACAIATCTHPRPTHQEHEPEMVEVGCPTPELCTPEVQVALHQLQVAQEPAVASISVMIKPLSVCERGVAAPITGTVIVHAHLSDSTCARCSAWSQSAGTSVSCEQGAVCVHGCMVALMVTGGCLDGRLGAFGAGVRRWRVACS